MAHRRILLIDGSSLAFRAFYSILDLDRFRNKEGLHTNALYSFNRMLDNVLNQFDPSHVLVAFDQSGPTLRSKKFDEYKGNRQKTPSEFKEQLPYFRVLLDAYGISYHDLADYEADDIIGTLSRLADDQDEVFIITGDRDLIQLAQDHVTVYVTKRGVSNLEAYTPSLIDEKYQLSPQQIIDLKGLMGDSSDNYPGVTRVGEKTALKLLHQFGSIANLYDHLDDLKASKMKENLINDKDQAFLSRDLAEIITDVPLHKDFEDIRYRGKDPKALLAFYQQMQFNSFLEDLRGHEDLANENLSEAKTDLKQKYQVEWLENIEPDHLPMNCSFFSESLEDNYHFAEILALAWSDPEEGKVYVTDLKTALASQDFATWIENKEAKKCVFDSKREQVLYSQKGLKLMGMDFDCLLANYLIDTHNAKNLPEMLRSQDLPELVDYDETIYGKGNKQKVPSKEALIDHLANKVIALDILKEPLTQALDKVEMRDLYQTIELPLARVLAGMEIEGIKVDGDILTQKNEALIERLKTMEANIYDLAGQEFNINSVKQLGEVLFEKLGLPVIKKTKTGYSTAASVLEKISDSHPIIPAILEYRQISKLQGTYLAGLPSYIKEDGKIHTRFIQTLTQTGRLSSSDPNLQNIPIRIEEGRRIRQAFVPSQPGWQFFGADYSQIELRVLAHISQDQHMLEAFKAGEDIHEATARRVFALDANDKVDSQMRRQAKAVNFGIVYGISDYGLSQNLNINRKQAKEFIDRYFDKYPDIAKFMDEIVDQAREQGYVSTLFHRRRYLPDIKASNYNVRSFAERTAMNSPIQGTAADIIKIAMVNIDQALEEKDLKSKLLLTVHDEVILEGPAEEMEILSDLIPEIMEGAVDLDVPLRVDYNQGNDWYDLK